MKVLSVVGNRPQFIKSGPLSVALREAGIEEVVLHTGQHYDRELSDVFFEELGLAEPAYRLEAHTRDVDAMLPGIVDALERERPDAAVVFGDTNSTLAGARAARQAGVPFAHVEAGMRSGDMTMPEEHTRIEVDSIADLLLCPDERSRGILEARGRAGDDRGRGRRDGRRVLHVRADRSGALGRARSARASAGDVRRGHDPPRRERRRAAARPHRGRTGRDRRARDLSGPSREPALHFWHRDCPSDTSVWSSRSRTSTSRRSPRRPASSSRTRAGCRRRRTGTASRA